MADAYDEMERLMKEYEALAQSDLPAAGGQPVFGDEAVFRDGDLPHLPCASASGG